MINIKEVVYVKTEPLIDNGGVRRNFIIMMVVAYDEVGNERRIKYIKDINGDTGWRELNNCKKCTIDVSVELESWREAFIFKSRIPKDHDIFLSPEEETIKDIVE